MKILFKRLEHDWLYDISDKSIGAAIEELKQLQEQYGSNSVLEYSVVGDEYIDSYILTYRDETEDEQLAREKLETARLAFHKEERELIEQLRIKHFG